MPAGRYKRWLYHCAFPRLGWVSILPLSPPGWYKAVPSLLLRAAPSRGSLPQEDCHSGGGDVVFAVGCVVTITGRQTSPNNSNRALSSEGSTYLFAKIREYCREDSKDAVCPAPSLPTHQPPRDPPSAVYQESLLVNAL